MSKKITIGSNDFCDSIDYCWADIVDGAIISLQEDNFREGGEIWSPTHNSNGDMQHCLARLARDYGMKFYKAVYNAAYREHLDTPYQVRNRSKQKRITPKKVYDEAKDKLRKLGSRQ